MTGSKDIRGDSVGSRIKIARLAKRINGVLTPLSEVQEFEVTPMRKRGLEGAAPEQVVAFGEEMDAAGADWQLHGHGGAVHAFTNPGANDPDFGTVYHEAADRRSWQSLDNFLAELFAG